MEKINGGIPPLHLSGNIYENWRFFIQRFKNYLKATEMDKKNQATQCAQLLHMVGENGFRIYNTFKFEDNEREKIEPLIAKFENYFKPRSNISNVRYNLFTRKQHEGKPIANFITEVTTLAQQCELGDLEDSLIKTCITCGVADERMRQRLLEDDEMTLEKAITLCKSMESSHEQAVKIGTSKNEIHYISKKNFNASRQHRNKMTSQSSANREQRPSSRHRNNINGNRRSKDIPKCYRCGLDHQGQICRTIKAKCNFCNKLGHYSKMCTQKQINVVEKSADESESLFLGLVNNHSDQLGRDDDFENFIINFEVNNKTLKCKLDTGKCNLKCKYEGKYYNIDFYVVDVDAPSIIGLPTCKSLKVIKRIHSLEVNERPPPLMKYDDIKLKYSELFTGIGCLDEPYTIRVDHTVMPVVHPPRKIPLALKDNLKVELDEMEKNQIIEKVDMPTDWVNSLVIVKKPNSNKVRICIDPRDLNRAIKREHFQLPSLDEIAPNLRGNKFFSKLDASKGFWSIKLDEESSNLCTFNTCYGRYKFLRLPYGIKSASERGKELYIADTLSRCCAEKPETKSNLDIELESQICLIKLSFNISEVQLNKIIMETKKDVELIMLKSFLKNDWPDETNLSGNLKTLYKIRDEIYYHNGLFLRKNQIIIPKSMYKEMLARIHYGHQGISKSKHLARQSLYWPAMTAHIEDEVKRCKTCARFQNNIREPLISHNIPKLPWEEIGSDLFHIGNDTYLIVVDYYSKYPEICLLKDTDSKTVINHLKSIFARHGIPKVFYSDGGPQYISHEFEIFCKEWEFQSVKSSPQNSKSNGLAERFIQTYKKALQKSYTDRKDTYLTLLQLRNTPINNNLPSPSQLLMSRVLRTNIPTTDKILKPQTFNANKIQANLRNAQTMQKYYYDRGTTKQKPLDNGVNVYIRDKIGIREGVVKNRVRDRTYTVQLQNSNYVNRNRRFLIPIPVDKDNYNDEHQEELFEEEIINDSNSDANKVNEEISPQRTSSGRMVKKPVRLNL
ncbi:hypothetical protein PPYR_05928 [Photinus pyralis]|uniref:RNA-directed DNA polymerase n=1 Tax=Photinus pyralis TaxID=7054 RepID=A0A5N4ASJ0_PHOPY|nr:hypothetical protein PPYR_05928 [Photinus pyralis]